MPATRRGRKPATTPPLNVKPYDTAPKAPATLGTHGRDCWQRLAPLLVEMRWLTPLHLESLEALCDWWHVYQTHKLYLQKHPKAESFQTESGYEQRSPRAVARNEAWTNFAALSARFGLTPDALAKLRARGGKRGASVEPETPGAKITDFAALKYKPRAS